MTFILKQIYQLIRLLNSENGTNQIAAGIAAGFILGMTPVFSLQSIIVFFCIFFFRIQAGAALLSAGLFAIAGYLLDPIFDKIGKQVLEYPNFQDFFTFLYNLPILPFTHFNNSVVMGSGVFTLLTSPLIFVLAVYLVKTYRIAILEKWKKTKISQTIRITSLYKWYEKYHQLYGS